MKSITTDPKLLALLEKAAQHRMTDDEINEQRKSWVRGQNWGTAILFSAVILAAPAHAAYGVDATKAALACTGQTISEATKGDFSHWVLPAFIGGTHLRAGQWVDENCQVRP